jgi:hypothetical protein
MVLLAVGVVALVDAAGAHVPASTYFAVALVVVGGGLVLGAWYGHAKGLIAVGVLLSLGLAITAAAEGWKLGGPHGNVTWKPTSIELLQRSYEVNVGNGTLDLSAVDFAGRSESIDVHVSMGNLQIILPSDVDVQVGATVQIGNATVFGQNWSGVNQPQHSVFDAGDDGPGGGQLTINATVDVGDLGVRR